MQTQDYKKLFMGTLIVGKEELLTNSIIWVKGKKRTHSDEKHPLWLKGC